MTEKKKPGRPPAAKKPLPPDTLQISLTARGRGNVKWDGKQLRVPAPGSWIAFPGHAGFPIDEIIVPVEAVKALCNAVGYAPPPTDVEGTEQ